MFFFCVFSVYSLFGYHPLSSTLLPPIGPVVVMVTALAPSFQVLTLENRDSKRSHSGLFPQRGKFCTLREQQEGVLFKLENKDMHWSQRTSVSWTRREEGWHLGPSTQLCQTKKKMKQTLCFTKELTWTSYGKTAQHSL